MESRHKHSKGDGRPCPGRSYGAGTDARERRGYPRLERERQKTETASLEYCRISRSSKSVGRNVRKLNALQENRKPVPEGAGFLCCEVFCLTVLRAVDTLPQQAAKRGVTIRGRRKHNPTYCCWISVSLRSPDRKDTGMRGFLKILSIASCYQARYPITPKAEMIGQGDICSLFPPSSFHRIANVTSVLAARSPWQNTSTEQVAMAFS